MFVFSTGFLVLGALPLIISGTVSVGMFTPVFVAVFLAWITA